MNAHKAKMPAHSSSAPSPEASNSDRSSSGSPPGSPPYELSDPGDDDGSRRNSQASLAPSASDSGYDGDRSSSEGSVDGESTPSNRGRDISMSPAWEPPCSSRDREPSPHYFGTPPRNRGRSRGRDRSASPAREPSNPSYRERRSPLGAWERTSGGPGRRRSSFYNPFST